jgi:hypothetical protein
MGSAEANMKPRAGLSNFCVLVAVAAFAAATLATDSVKKTNGSGSAKADKTIGTAKMKAKQEIEQLREGKAFSGDIGPFLAPEAVGLELLAAELRQNPSSAVRGQIVKALVQIGTKSDPQGRLSNRRILSILVGDASLRNDGPYMVAMDQIAELSPPSSIREYGQSLLKLLAKSPSSGLLLAIAKAKIIEARPAIEALKTDKIWGKEEIVPIALAALGDHELERRFVDKFLQTLDAQEKMDLAGTLGRIGTRTALEALAQEMRSPLIFEIPAAYEQSVRPDIAKAIHSNYPDKEFLLVIRNEADYERIEKFCEQEFKTVWKTDRPPFLVMQPLAPPPG